MKKLNYLFIVLMLCMFHSQAQIQNNSFKVAVFPVTFTDVPLEYRNQFPTQSEFKELLFGNNSKIQEYFDVISYNKLNFTGDVFDYTVANYKPWSPGASIKEASDILKNVNINAPAGFNPSNYDRIIVLIGHDAALGGSRAGSFNLKINGVTNNHRGVATFFRLGRYNRETNYPVRSSITQNSHTLVVSSTNPPKSYEPEQPYPLSSFESTYIHEVIHSMGIGAHANSRTNNGKHDYEPQDANNGSNWENEYGNMYDIMGKAGGYASTLNGYFRRVLNLMDDSMLNILDSYTTQTVTVHPINYTSGKRLIAVYHPDFPTQWPGIYQNDGYTLEVKANSTFDPLTSIPEVKGNADGLFVYKNSGLKNLLLDMSPAPNVAFGWGDYYDVRDVVLKPGMTYENDEVKFSNVIKNADGSFNVTIRVKKIGGDTGTAPIAQFTANNTSITAGQSVVFTDQSTNEPTSWSWSFAGGNPSTSTAQNPTVTYTTPGTYQVSLTAANTHGNDTNTKTSYITVNPASCTYCASASSTVKYEYIKEVKIGNFTNVSDAQKYSDFTNKTIPLVKGKATNITLTPEWPKEIYKEYFKIWIDLNGDCDFNDSGELVFDAGSAKKTAVTGTITVPTSAITGNTRMRVSMKYNGAPNPCANGSAFGDGEVEDYTVNISTSALAEKVQGDDITVFPNPVSQGKLHIHSDFEEGKIQLIDITGKAVLTQNTLTKLEEINVNGLHGVFILMIKSGKETIYKQVIIE